MSASSSISSSSSCISSQGSSSLASLIAAEVKKRVYQEKPFTLPISAYAQKKEDFLEEVALLILSGRYLFVYYDTDFTISESLITPVIFEGSHVEILSEKGWIIIEKGSRDKKPYTALAISNYCLYRQTQLESCQKAIEKIMDWKADIERKKLSSEPKFASRAAQEAWVYFIEETPS